MKLRSHKPSAVKEESKILELAQPLKITRNVPGYLYHLLKDCQHTDTSYNFFAVVVDASYPHMA
jgi:hypothetical protein